MMILVKLRFLSVLIVLALISCSTKYIVTGINGQKATVKGKIDRKIYFRTAKGIPMIVESKSIDSLYINVKKTVVLNNQIFYESKLKLKGSKTMLGFIIANNRFIGGNDNLKIDVPFDKILLIEKVK